MRLLAPLICSCLLSGCGLIWRIGPGGAAPTLFHTDVVYPNQLDEPGVAEVPYDPSTIEIIGWVESGESKSSGVAGRIPGPFQDLVGVDNSDYGSAYRELVKRHGLDGLIDTSVDTDRWVLNLILIRFHRQATRVGGIGWRFRPGHRPPGFPEPPKPALAQPT